MIQLNKIKQTVFHWLSQGVADHASSNQFFQHLPRIERWLEGHGIKNYLIHDDLTVDVRSDVDLSNRQMNFLPVQFRFVDGHFNLSNNKLTSLKGSPTTVTGDFSCHANQLRNLEFCPQSVGWVFNARQNCLENLTFLPQMSKNFFWCDGNPLLGDVQKVSTFAEIRQFYQHEIDIQSEKSNLEKAILTPTLKSSSLSRMKI